MRIGFIKYSRLKVQAQESCCPDSSLGIETYLFYCALQTLRAFFFENKLKVVAIMYGASLAASFFKAAFAHFESSISRFVNSHSILNFLLLCYFSVIGVDVTVVILGYYKPQP